MCRIFLSLIIVATLVVGCDRGNNIVDESLRPNDENAIPDDENSMLGGEDVMDITPSAHSVLSEGGEFVSVVVNYNQWFIAEVDAQIGDNDYIEIYSSRGQQPIEDIVGSWYRLEVVKAESYRLHITIDKNSSALVRRLFIRVSVGDMDGQVMVEQEAADIEGATEDVVGTLHYLSSKGGVCESRLVSGDSWQILSVEAQVGDDDMEEYNNSEQPLSDVIDGPWFKVEVPKSDSAALRIEIDEHYQRVVRRLAIIMAAGDKRAEVNVVQEPDYVIGDNGDMIVRNSRHNASSEGGEFISELLNYASWTIRSVEEQLGDGESAEITQNISSRAANYVQGSWYRVEIPDGQSNKLRFVVASNNTSQRRKLVVCMRTANKECMLELVQK